MVRKTNNKIISFYKSIGFDPDPVIVLSKRLIEDKKHKFGWCMEPLHGLPETRYIQFVYRCKVGIMWGSSEITFLIRNGEFEF